MRAVVQRTKRAEVLVKGETVGRIESGLVVLLGVEEGDTQEDALYLANKIAKLRVFEDEAGKMNRSVRDEDKEVLLVSQFTLLGDARKGNRPSFIRAARPQEADALYECLQDALGKLGVAVQTGRFQTVMDVVLTNHGPVTVLLDSNKTF